MNQAVNAKCLFSERLQNKSSFQLLPLLLAGTLMCAQGTYRHIHIHTPRSGFWVKTQRAIFYSSKLFWLPLQYISILCGGVFKVEVACTVSEAAFFSVCMSFWSLHVIFGTCYVNVFFTISQFAKCMFCYFFDVCVFANKSRKYSL